MEGEQEEKPKSGLNPIVIIAVVLGLAVLGGGLLATNRNSSQIATQSQGNNNRPEVAGTFNVSETDTLSMEENSDSAQGESEVKVFRVEAGSFYYNPKEIRVNLGDRVKVELTAKDMMHDFNVDEFGVDGPVIKAGETTTMEFTVEKSGEFEYYCSVGQHRLNGQVGTLIVEE